MKKGNVNTSTLKFIFTNKLVASKNCFNLLNCRLVVSANKEEIQYNFLNVKTKWCNN